MIATLLTQIRSWGSSRTWLQPSFALSSHPRHICSWQEGTSSYATRRFETQRSGANESEARSAKQARSPGERDGAIIAWRSWNASLQSSPMMAMTSFRPPPGFPPPPTFGYASKACINSTDAKDDFDSASVASTSFPFSPRMDPSESSESEPSTHDNLDVRAKGLNAYRNHRNIYSLPELGNECITTSVCREQTFTCFSG